MAGHEPRPSDPSQAAAACERRTAQDLVGEAIVRSSHVGVAVIDPSGTVALVNPGLERILCVSRQKVVGRHIQTLLRCRRRVREPLCPAQLILDAWTTGAHCSGRASICSAPGRVGPVMVIVSTFPLGLAPPAGSGSGVVALIQDMVQQEILTELLTSAERLAVVSQLIAYAAHDLRGPLTSIKGLAQLIQMGRVDAPTRARYSATICREVDELDRMVAALLRLGRRPGPETVPVNLVRLTRETLDLVIAKAVLQGVTLNLTADPEACTEVAADPFRLKHALLNLIINSLQAMPHGGRLELSVSVRTRDDAKEVVLDLADSGPGMEASALEHALDPFYTTKENGTGLGLPVTRMTVMELGGRMELLGRGRLGGLEVIIHLPAANGVGEAKPGAQSPP